MEKVMIGLVFLILLTSCRSNEIDKRKLETIRTFIRHLHANELESALQMTYRKDTWTRKDDIVYARDLLVEYEILSERRWRIEYDIASDVYKLKKIIVPIAIDRKLRGKYNGIDMVFGFDYTGNVVPDTTIAWFYLDRKIKNSVK